VFFGFLKETNQQDRNGQMKQSRTIAQDAKRQSIPLVQTKNPEEAIAQKIK